MAGLGETETRLILIRHGETGWNVQGRYQGQANPPLNACGRAQAERLAQSLREVGLDMLYASPLRRAWGTALVVAQVLHLPLYEEPRLKEILLGEWQGMLYQDIMTQYPELLRDWKENPWSVRPPGGETLSEVQRRVYQAVEEILARHEGRCVGLVTHETPLAMLLMRFRGLGPEVVGQLHWPNTHWEEIRVAGSLSADVAQGGIRQDAKSSQQGN